MEEKTTMKKKIKLKKPAIITLKVLEIIIF